MRAFAGYFGAAQNVWFVHAGMRLAEVRFVPLVEMSEDVDQDDCATAVNSAPSTQLAMKRVGARPPMRQVRGRQIIELEHDVAPS
jgi:hypothetical protein